MNGEIPSSFYFNSSLTNSNSTLFSFRFDGVTVFPKLPEDYCWMEPNMINTFEI